jgi:hypothetical protein
MKLEIAGHERLMNIMKLCTRVTFNFKRKQGGLQTAWPFPIAPLFGSRFEKI